MSKKRDPHDVIRAPAITEKSTLVSEHNQVVFKVARGRQQGGNPGRRREAVQRESPRRQYSGSQRQDESLQEHPGSPERQQTRNCDPRGGAHDRYHHRALRSDSRGFENIPSTTPGLRQLVLVDRGHLWKGAPIKMLTDGKTKSGGRNNYGRITTRHIGGGHKQAYRRVDFRRGKHDISARVERLEYDPNRTAFIALLKYHDGTLSYILAPQRLAVGDSVVAGVKADVKPGNAMHLASLPIGTIVHNIEIKAGGGGKIARSAGAYGQLVGRDAGWAILRLNSGETRRVRAECMATVGAVSNPDHLNEFDWQSRPYALEGYASHRALDCHEPDRSPQRRPHQGWQALGYALGQADQGRQDAQEQGDRSVHHSPTQQSQVG